MPFALTRFLRRPLARAVLLVVCALTVGVAQISDAYRIQLTATISAHWRGSYDILVRPHGIELRLEQTAGLVEPNFLGLSASGGISSNQLEAIRAMDGVAVAAPIAWVGLIPAATTSPSIELTSFPPKPTLYEATIRVSTSDGLTSRTVSEGTLRLLVGPIVGARGPTVILGSGDMAVGPAPRGGWVVDINDHRAAPQLQSPLVAVDPGAEKALLGDQGGFLAPLLAVPDRDALTVANVNPDLVPPPFDQGSDLRMLQTDGGAALSRPVFPVLVSSRAYAPLVVSVSIDQLGHPLDEVPDPAQGSAGALDAAAAAAGPGRTHVGDNEVDWSDRLRAFRTNGIGVPWPGQEFAEDAVPVALLPPTSIDATVVGRPTYGPMNLPSSFPGRSAFEIEPAGPVSAGGLPLASLPTGRPSRLGAEQSYRSTAKGTMGLRMDHAPVSVLDAPYYLAPVGEYDLDALRLPVDPLTYVPYGIYDPPNTDLIGDPAGNLLVPRPLSPTLNPAGLLAEPPMGIVDIHAAELLRGTASIDAVRVRVAGIGQYSPDALAKVEAVAAQIAGLGLDVDVVAASSPQPVDLFVPNYNVGSSGNPDLGWIQQRWTTLGAAPNVERGLDATNAALVALSLVAVSGLALVFGFVSAGARRRERELLNMVGWSRERARRWLLGEELSFAAVVAAVGITGWLFGGRGAVALIAALGAPAAVVLIGTAVSIGDRSQRRPWIHPPRIRGRLSYSVRQLLAAPRRTVGLIFGAALAFGTLAPALAMVESVGVRLGPTALAGAAQSGVAGYQVALLATVVAAGVLTSVVSVRADVDARRRELGILANSGWTLRAIRQMLMLSRLLVAVPGALGAALLGATLSPILTGQPAMAISVAGVSAAFAFCVTMLVDLLVDPGPS